MRESHKDSAYIEFAKRVLNPRPTFLISEIPQETPKLWLQEKMIKDNVFMYIIKMHWDEGQIPNFLTGPFAMPHANPRSLLQVNHSQASKSFDSSVNALIKHNLNFAWDAEVQGKYVRWAHAIAANALYHLSPRRSEFQNVRNEVSITRHRMLTNGLRQSAVIDGLEPNFSIINYIFSASQLALPPSLTDRLVKTILRDYINQPYETQRISMFINRLRR